MNPSANVVSIHPYFKVHPGKLEQFKAALPQFVSQTATEKNCLSYDFTINGEIVFCRESYVGAAGLLAHIENVGQILAGILQLSDLVRLEVHGPAAELEKLRGPLAGLKPEWFVYLCGLES